MNIIKPDPILNFASIPGSISKFFNIETDYPSLPDEYLSSFKSDYQKVCLLLIDAFGWRFLKEYSENGKIPLLDRIKSESNLYKIHSQFPSTTAVHITTIHSGLPIAESGICEWNYYESRIDKVIQPLPFTTPEEKETGSLLKAGIKAEDFIPRGWFYPTIEDKGGINTCICLKKEHTISPYSTIQMGKNKRIVYEQDQEGLSKLTDALIKSKGQTYAYYYFGDFDEKMHNHGPFSTESKICLEQFFKLFNEQVILPLSQANEKVLFLITADHGMTKMDPKSTIYLENISPELISHLKTTKEGKPIYPTGSSKDLFLHIKEDYLERSYKELSTKLDGKAKVFHVSDLIKQGFFGNRDKSQAFLNNIGDLLISPEYGESVFWMGPNGKYLQKFQGQHGGLSKEEMETIFIPFGI